MKKSVILVPIVGLILIVVIGVLFFTSSFTGNAVILAGAYTCISNSIGAQVYNPNYNLYYQNNNVCKDASTLTQYTCTSATASNWFSALFMTTSANLRCQYGCANNVCLPPPSCVDGDGDGYGTGCALGVDCNDASAAINPSAGEVCDTLDNNCNMQIDEGVTRTCMDFTTCQNVQTCVAVCPSAPVETCNGRDDNCNGQIDENVQCGPTCGNGVCETGETTTSCPADCKTSATLPTVPAKAPMIIGVEYAFDGTATSLTELGITGVKMYPEFYTMWDAMQPSQTGSINFAALDSAIRNYQTAGFKDVTIGLRSANRWASKDVDFSKTPAQIRNPLPKAEFVAAHDAWVKAIVERYDKDGVSDMPNLKYPVKFYEVGVEFSSYEPEPADEYVAHLDRVYGVIHAAYPSATVAHAAFLTMGVFDKNPYPTDMTAAFNNVPDTTHTYADVQKILDRPQSFDVLNVHSLADPRELDGLKAWLTKEMQARGYSKKIIVSDTGITPFIAFGPATFCSGPLTKGALFYPATENDRCRLAAYFNQLLNESQYPQTVAWAHGFVAEDVVKRAVVGADNEFVLMNMAFVEDLTWLKPLAGAGNMAWGGMVTSNWMHFATSKRASFYALKQLQSNIKGYTRVGRVDVGNADVRAYLFMKGSTPVWVVWYAPAQLVLPGDTVPSTQVTLPVVSATTVEKLITKDGQTTPEKSALTLQNGFATITVTPTPVFVY